MVTTVDMSTCFPLWNACMPQRKRLKTEKDDWFQDTFGFKEKGYEFVRKQFRIEQNDTILVSLNNDRKFHIGKFETPSLEQLDERVIELVSNSVVTYNDDNPESNMNINGLLGLKFEHVVANVKDLIMDPKNENAVFQVASQFNCLEMYHPAITPDAGITSYKDDETQGPICAVACAAGTVYRNYFINEYGQGGKKGKQIDCLDGVGQILENDREEYWTMRNGYALPTTAENLVNLKRKIYGDYYLSKTASGKLKVGVHHNTEVTIGPSQHRVTQVYCSAIPIGYSTIGKIRDFEPFAKLILDATYKATFAIAAIKALESNKRVDLYLTKVGGGVFGNRSRWIVEAIRKSLKKFEDFPLNVHLIHYGTALEQAYTDVWRVGDESKLISDYITSNMMNFSSQSLDSRAEARLTSTLSIKNNETKGNHASLETGEESYSKIIEINSD